MSRYKEDQRHERIIRSLAKLEANRRCINCGSLGPQFICTNFATFVCMACSGVHREFTHRVKSISMSKFSSEEVADLQHGGNQPAFEFYFKDWDPRRHPVPDSRNPEKLREFIKAIYVDQIYAGKSAAKGADYDARKSDVRASFSLSSQELLASPTWPHQRAKSEDNTKSHDFGYSPPVRSMREILGDGLPPLRIEPASREAPSASSTDNSQRSSQFSRFGSFTGSTPAPPNPAASKRANSEGQIDFNVEITTPSDFVFAPQQPYVQADTTGWATFDSVPEASASGAEESKDAPLKQVDQCLQGATGFSMPEKRQLWPPWNFGEPRPPVSEEFFVQPPYEGTSGPPSQSQQFTPVMQQVAVPQKSRNPFDLPEDSSPSVTSPSFTFPPVPIPEFISPQHSWPQPPFYPPPDAYADSTSNIPTSPQSRPGNPFA